MKKIFFFLMLTLAAFSFCSQAATHDVHEKNGRAKETQQVDLYFFWSNDCPHCVAAHPFIDKLKAERPWLKVHSYEVSGNPKNSRLFEKMSREHGRETSFVPAFFVCDKMIVGFSSVNTTGDEIREAVDACHH